MRLKLSLFFCLMLGSVLNAQEPKERVEYLIEKAEFYLQEDFRLDSALYFAAQTLNYKDELQEERLLKEKIELTLYKIHGRLGNDSLVLVHLTSLTKIQGYKHNFLPSPVSYVNMGRLGTHFLKIEDFLLADHFFTKALEIAKITEKKSFISGSYNNLGLLFERQALDAEALQMYQLGLTELSTFQSSDTDSSLRVSIQENVARILFKEGDFRKAEIILLENYRFLEGEDAYKERKVRAGFQLINLYDSLKQYSNIPSYLLDLEVLIEGDEKNQNFDNRIKLQLAWLRYYKLTGQVDLALEKQGEINELSDKLLAQLREQNKIINLAISNTRIEEINAEFESQELKLKNAKLEISNKSSMLIFTILFSLFGIAVIFFYQKRRIVMNRLSRELEKKELENQQIRNQQLEQDFKHKEADFSNFIMQHTMKENLTLDIIEKLNEFLKDKKIISSSELKKLIRQLKPQKDITEKMEMYQDGVDEVNSSFYENLSNQFPVLSKTEREVCGLMRINLTGKEIASLRNINPASVRKMRNRIRKKLKLDPSIDLYVFLQRF